MSSKVTVCALALLAACGHVPANRMPRTLDGGVRKFEASELYAFQIIRRETPPPGYQPSAKLESCDPHWASLNEPSRRMGVVTIAIGDGRNGDIRVKWKIEHVDDSEPIQAIRRENVQGDKWRFDYMVPIVGPAGERLSQMYRDDAFEKGYGMLSPLGSPVPRLHLYCGAGANTAFVVDGKEKDFVIPVSRNGTMPRLPADVVGAQRIDGAWLVRWKGAQEGWSVSATDDLSAFADTSPRYKSVRKEEVYQYVDVVVGERFDGTCEVTLARTVSAADLGNFAPTGAADCTGAIAAMDALVRKDRAYSEGVAAQRAADDAKRDAEHAIAAKQATEREQAAAAEAARISKAEEEKRKKEEPILRKYLALLADNKPLDACDQANKLAIESHARFIAYRFESDELGLSEVDCVLQRRPPSVIADGMDFMKRRILIREEARQRREEEEAAEERRAERRAARRALAKEGPKAPTTTQTTKAVNDYMYGSGHASSCPFEDKTYCY